MLDFACGSGALACALLLRTPSLRVTLLDADPLALRAAAHNAAAAAVAARRAGGATAAAAAAAAPRPPRRVLSDGWASLRPSARFRCIVANPPAHAGAADHHGVIASLLSGAPERLLPGGTLWLVAQAQVLIGRLAASAAVGSWRSVDAHVLAGGRFVAWEAVARGGCGEGEGAGDGHGSG